jgi:hypothetical protein
MAGLVPAIYVFGRACDKDTDARFEPACGGSWGGGSPSGLVMND